MMSSPSELWGPGEERTHVIFCFIVGIALLVALGVLLIWHMYLSMTAQTTVEFYLNTRFDDQASQNLFDLVSWRKNVPPSKSALPSPSTAGRAGERTVQI